MQLASDIPVMATVYKLSIGDYWYVGSTTASLKARIAVHRSNSAKYPERKLYKHITGAGGWSNVKCEVLKMGENKDKVELHTWENEYIRLDDPFCLNMHRATLTEEERVEASRRQSREAYHRLAQDPAYLERQRERQKKYYAERKDDPAFLEMKRISALESYYRRKVQKTTAAESGVAKD